MKALGMPQSNDAEIAAREQGLQDGLKHATEVRLCCSCFFSLFPSQSRDSVVVLWLQVPLHTMRLGADKELWQRLVQLAPIGNFESHSDLEVGVRMLQVGVWGAMRNVLINLGNIRDADYAARIKQEAEALMQFVNEQTDVVLKIMDQRVAVEKRDLNTGSKKAAAVH